MTTILPRMSHFLILGFALISFSVLPGIARAAEAPACTLIVSTPQGNSVFSGDKDVSVRAGDRIFIGRIGQHATEARDQDGKSVSNVGLEVLAAPSKDRTYAYRFGSGSKEASCSVSLRVEKAVQEKQTEEKKAPSSEKRSSDAKPAAGGTLSVSQLPLLAGGSAAPGASVPVAYIKVSNPGTAATSLAGFSLKQSGSAPTDVITSFATNDDKGGSRATAKAEFEGKEAFVPLQATVAPGQTRIFTIKAQLASGSGASAGKQLMLDVASVDTGASARGAFPIRGTTWTLTR